MRQAGLDLFHGHPQDATKNDIEDEVHYEIWDLRASKQFGSITGLINTQYACSYDAFSYQYLLYSRGQSCE
jgi:hypothetical protein